MNPIIQKHFDQVHAAIDELENGIAAQRETITTQHKKHEEALQRYWSQSRELAQLREIAQQTAMLRERNQELLERHEKVRERLQFLLEQTRVLTSEALQ